MFKHLVYWLAPAMCVRCGLEGPLMCDECAPFIASTKLSACFLCNRRTKGFATCKTCRRSAQVDKVFIASHYEGSIKELITRFKYGNAIEASSLFADILTPYIPFENYDKIVPVPSSARRQRRRGYNPAALIARKISRRSGIPYSEALGRLGHSRQVGAKRRRRLEQLQGKFYIRKSKGITNKRILLIDDVVTTGTTLNECAKVLKAAGAKSISAAVIAKH